MYQPMHLVIIVNVVSITAKNRSLNTHLSLIPHLTSPGLFQWIEFKIIYIHMHIKIAHPLIHNENNDKSVHLMSVLSKYNRAKRFRLTMCGSFNSRVDMSALMYNTWLYSSWIHLTKMNLRKVLKRYITNNRSRFMLYKWVKFKCVHQKTLPILLQVLVKWIATMECTYAIEPDRPLEQFQDECKSILKKMQLMAP